MATEKQAAQIKKISVKTVFGAISVKELLKAPGEFLEIMDVMGAGVSVASGTSTFGEWQALQGVFEAVNLDTGERFASSSCFLPDVALTPLLVALAAPGARGVEFAIRLGVKYVSDAKPGGSVYEYTFKPLLPPDDNDPVSRIKAKLLALAAPANKADETPAPAEAPAPKASKSAK